MRKKPCKVHGMLSPENITSQDRCRLCVNEWARNWKKDNRDRVNATNARSRKNSPETWGKFYKRQYKNKRTKHGSNVLPN